MFKLTAHPLAKLLLLVGVFGFVSVVRPAPVTAAYDGGQIVSDVYFLDAHSMSATSIQSFLALKGSGLANMNFKLDCYAQDSKERQWYTAAGAPCDQTIPASQIIYYASQVYGVSPKVVLATLQKEQSLVTSPNPTSWQINQAMGYGCPTTGGCGASTFFYQIDSGIWVLRYHFERARGNMTWWTTSTTWTCGTEKNFYKPNLYPRQNVSFYDEDGVLYRTHYIMNAATSSMYCYTPHTYNNPQGLYGRSAYGTVGRYYSGSYNFVYYYELWFGSTILPTVIKSPSSSTIYAQTNGYKFYVPTNALLQDFGLSTGAQTVPQATLDSIPTPDSNSGMSNSLGNVVKSPSDSDADGGTLYLVTNGKRYGVKTMQQFADFGYDVADIKYIPLDFIQSIPNGGLLSNFAKSGKNTFQISGGTKKLILDPATLQSLNPSGQVTPVNRSVVDPLASTLPVTNGYALVSTPAGAMYVFSANTYYYIPSSNQLSCWGLTSTLGMTEYELSKLSDVATISSTQGLGCGIETDSGTQYLLNGTSRVTVPPSYGLSTSTSPLVLQQLANKLPLRQAPLSRAIKQGSSATVWYIESGVKKAIPTMKDLELLGIESGGIDIVKPGAAAIIPTSGIKLGVGQVARDSGSGAIYVITSPTTKTYIPNADLFNAYRYRWDILSSYSTSTLNQYYSNTSASLSRYMYTAAGNVYLMDSVKCYGLSDSQLTSYGTSRATVQSNQTHASSIFPYVNLVNCTFGSTYVRSPQGTVYFVSGGQKHSFGSWAALVSHAQTSNPYITPLGSASIAELPNGTPVN